MELIYLKDVPVYGDEIGSFFAMKYNPNEDISKFERAFNSWKQDRENQRCIHGRAPNLSDGFTEGLFCLATGSVRYMKPPEKEDLVLLLGTKEAQFPTIKKKSTESVCLRDMQMDLVLVVLIMDGQKLGK